jgi:hypothetical protein
MEKEDLTVDEREIVKKFSKKLGDGAAARELGITVNSLLRIVAGRQVRRGTLHLLRTKLKEIALGMENK